MDTIDPQLVRAIAEQVIAVLRQRGVVPEAANSGSSLPAPVRPPAGTCTGDYSKFAGSQVAADASSAAPPPAAIAHQVVPLTGIVTASQLQAAMDASPDGVAVLAPDARLSPLGNDLARQHPKRVKRASALSANPAGQPAPLPWLWWIDGSCAAVEQIVAQRAGRLSAATAVRGPQGLSNVVRELSALLHGRRVAGGLLFVPSAAKAVCYANRCTSIRAVVGTCGEAVEQGVTELGANALVIEYPHQGPSAMAAMVDRMLQEAAVAPPAVERELADLHRCG